jgi:hypothetical protein
VKVEDVAVSLTLKKGRAFCSVSYVLLVDEWELGHWIEEEVVLRPDPCRTKNSDDDLVRWNNAPWQLVRAKDADSDEIRLKRATPVQELELDRTFDLTTLKIVASVAAKLKRPSVSAAASSRAVSMTP